MRLVRSRSQSSRTPQSANFFTGLKHWRRRRASNTAPSSPQATSVTANSTGSLPVSVSLSRFSSEHSIRPNRQCHHTTSTNEENGSSLPTTCMFAGTNTTPSAAASAGITTNSADLETTNTTRIRLLPNVELASRCFVFDIIDRILTPTTLLKIGRYSERRFMSDRLSFKSKVVSRTHAELWMELGNKIFIRDIGSSSGTFINRVRLSKSNETSQPMELRDGDIIQLGVDYQNDYQGAMDQMYRAVKMRLEINKDTNKINTFSRQAFLQFRQHFLDVSFTDPSIYTVDSSSNATGSEELDGGDRSSSRDNSTTGLLSRQHTNDISHGFALEGHDLPGESITNRDSNQTNTPCIQECCICLYAIAPLQALFIAPCSHGYHFKCLRPILLQHYPGFSCPLCRNYYDLEASVSEEMGLSTSSAEPTAASPTLSAPTTTSAPKSIGTTTLTISASSSIMQHYSPSSTQQYNQDQESDTYDDGERQHENPLARQAYRQTLFARNIDRHLLSSTTMDSSTVDQGGVYGNALTSL